VFAVLYGNIEDISAKFGDCVKFTCYSDDTGVEWRCSNDKYKNGLIYSRGNILSYATEFSIKIAPSWYNLTMTSTASNVTECNCFKASGGDVIKQYRATFLAGNA